TPLEDEQPFGDVTRDAASAGATMPVIHKGFTVCDLTTRMEDARYKARAAVMALDGSRTRFQRFLDFETFDTKAEATARAQAGAMAWIDAEVPDTPLALPTTLR